ncbi:MAG: hypothetical protein M1546_13295 [Chloroflexi bacterium]|nr:hypothetical protein [Chloroflexota bacterium]
MKSHTMRILTGHPSASPPRRCERMSLRSSPALMSYSLALCDNILAEVGFVPDLAFIAEEMCYRNGPMISPALVRAFMLPSYKQVGAFLHDHGITVFRLSNCGDSRALLPIFIEAGISMLLPLEASSNMDVVRLRQEYPRLVMYGGLDKFCLLAGRDSIDCELETKVPPVLRSGGYIPCLDAVIAPDIPLADYLYYRKRLNRLIDAC